MPNNDYINSAQITDLSLAETLQGDELLLIQGPCCEETQAITVDTLLANLVKRLHDGASVTLIESDPTVPSYIKSLTEDQVNALLKSLNEIEEIKKNIRDLQASTAKITSFSVTPSIVEIGTVLNTVTLKWETNFRQIIKITVEGVELPIDRRERVLDGPFKEDTTFSMSITGDDGSIDTKSTDLKFYNGIYYGASKVTPLSGDFIRSLTKVLSKDRNIGFTVTSMEQEYIYVALPARFGNPNFVIPNEEADFEFINQFQFINPSGYSEDYRAYRTMNVHLGQTTVLVR